MRIKTSQTEAIQTEFELLQTGDLFTITNNGEIYENGMFMKLGLSQDDPKSLAETKILDRSIKSIGENLMVNIKTGIIQEYEPHKDDIIMEIINGYLHVNT